MMFGYTNPPASVMRYFCRVAATSVLDLFDFVNIFFVDFPIVNCVCQASQGTLYASYLESKCYPWTPVKYRPLLLELLARSEGGRARMCGMVVNMTNQNLSTAFDSTFRAMYDGYTSIGSVFDYFLVFLDPASGTCSNYYTSDYVMAILPEPIDYFTMCYSTRLCELACGEQYDAFNSALVTASQGKGLVYSMNRTVNVESRFFTAGGEFYGTNRLPFQIMTLVEMSGCNRVCYGDISKSGPPSQPDRCISAAGIDSSLRIVVQAFCLPSDLRTGIRNASTVTDGSFPSGINYAVKGSESWSTAVMRLQYASIDLVDSIGESNILVASSSQEVVLISNQRQSYTLLQVIPDTQKAIQFTDLYRIDEVVTFPGDTWADIFVQGTTTTYSADGFPTMGPTCLHVRLDTANFANVIALKSSTYTVLPCAADANVFATVATPHVTCLGPSCVGVALLPAQDVCRGGPAPGYGPRARRAGPAADRRRAGQPLHPDGAQGGAELTDGVQRRGESELDDHLRGGRRARDDDMARRHPVGGGLRRVERHAVVLEQLPDADDAEAQLQRHGLHGVHGVPGAAAAVLRGLAVRRGEVHRDGGQLPAAAVCHRLRGVQDAEADAGGDAEPVPGVRAEHAADRGGVHRAAAGRGGDRVAGPGVLLPDVRHEGRHRVRRRGGDVAGERHHDEGAGDPVVVAGGAGAAGPDVQRAGHAVDGEHHQPLLPDPAPAAVHSGRCAEDVRVHHQQHHGCVQHGRLRQLQPRHRRPGYPGRERRRRRGVPHAGVQPGRAEHGARGRGRDQRRRGAGGGPPDRGRADAGAVPRVPHHRRDPGVRLRRDVRHDGRAADHRPEALQAPGPHRHHRLQVRVRGPGAPHSVEEACGGDSRRGALVRGHDAATGQHGQAVPRLQPVHVPGAVGRVQGQDGPVPEVCRDLDGLVQPVSAVAAVPGTAECGPRDGAHALPLQLREQGVGHRGRLPDGLPAAAVPGANLVPDLHVLRP
eukprot:765608-Hanusia_phi.AAC.5